MNTISITGSSPLTRGKLIAQPSRLGANGLIPTHAGKTRAPPMQTPTHGAHPRSRGENRAKKAHPAFQKGSSPLTQGKHLVASARHAVEGPIPAHARKTRRTAEPSQRSPAHPRPRGENRLSSIFMKSGWGSSPLTRGKHMRTLSLPTLARLIPTHAGKTSFRTGFDHITEAHPRSRGETSVISCRSRRAQAHPRPRGENRPLA